MVDFMVMVSKYNTLDLRFVGIFQTTSQLRLNQKWKRFDHQMNEMFGIEYIQCSQQICIRTNPNLRYLTSQRNKERCTSDFKYNNAVTF